MSTTSKLARLSWFIGAQLGLQPVRALRSIAGVVRYGKDLRRFRTSYGGRIEIMPCLNDWAEEAGAADAEYFLQDLLVARLIFLANPIRHVDIGSRIDGFVAHVASFREIEVLDIRPMGFRAPGVKFRQTDLMRPDPEMDGYCDSLSCLHALEHFGLGRYGDDVNPDGMVRGLENMCRLLKPGGTFYLSIPVGIERVEFNAHRITDPRALLTCAAQLGLELTTLTVIRNGRSWSACVPSEVNLKELAGERYTLAIFVFRRLAAA